MKPLRENSDGIVDEQFDVCQDLAPKLRAVFEEESRLFATRPALLARAALRLLRSRSVRKSISIKGYDPHAGGSWTTRIVGPVELWSCDVCLTQAAILVYGAPLLHWCGITERPPFWRHDSRFILWLREVLEEDWQRRRAVSEEGGELQCQSNPK